MYVYAMHLQPPFLHFHFPPLPSPSLPSSDMTLTVNDLSDVHGELYDVCTRWYDVGLALKVPVATLDSIDGQFNIYSDKLLQTLKVWLKTAIKPSWQDVVSVLKSPVVGEPKLASDIEAKYCTTAEVEQGQTMPELQRPKQVRGTVLLRQALRVSDQELVRVKDQLHESQRQNEELTLKVKTKNQQLESIEQREQAIEELRAASDQLKRQLQQAKQQVEEKQYATMEREKKVRELTVQLEAMKRAGQPPPIPLKAKRKMRWMKESKAPEKMHRGSTAVDANTAYFNSYDSTAVYSYNLDSREWHRLPDTPHAYSTLVVVQHMLTMVGGAILGRATDSLLSLGRDNKWLPNLPAMPTKRYFTAVVCSGHSLIVAGGRDGSNYLATVEVLDTDTQQWSVASSLTHPFSLATISICGERLYMLGGYDHTGKARCVLSCSLPELLKSCQTQPLAEKLRTAPANKSTIWRHVADAPHYYSSCATLCGQLVAVGGMEAGKNTSAITVYDETTDSWEAMGNMPTARRQALVAILNGKMMVIIGRVEGLVRTDVVGFLC